MSEQTATATSGSLLNASIAAWRCRRGLVAAQRHRAQLARREGRLGLVHDVDVLGEEHDLADRARELRGVVGRERRLRLADAAHHREDVLAGLRRLRLLELRTGDGTDELVALVLVEVADAQVARLDERAEAADEPVAELALGGADRAAEFVVELDGQVGDALGGQVGGDVDLAAAHDAEVDHGARAPRSRSRGRRA